MQLWAQIRSNNALALSTRLELFLNWTPFLPHHVHDKKQKSYSSQQTEEASSKKGGTTDNTVSDPLQHCIRRCSGPPLRILAPPREQFIWNKCRSKHTLFVYTVYLYDLTKESRQRAKLTSSIELQWVLTVWPYHWVMLASELECLRRARPGLRESDPWIFALHILCFLYILCSFVCSSVLWRWYVVCAYTRTKPYTESCLCSPNSTRKSMILFRGCPRSPKKSVPLNSLHADFHLVTPTRTWRTRLMNSA